MKLTRSILAVAVSIALGILSFSTLPLQAVKAQENVALQRGYRTGYSDGYMSGYRDAIDNESKSYTRHSEYGKADRAYHKEYGTLDDYRDGYKQGFEKGYETGFGKLSFEAAVPTDISRRGADVMNDPAAAVKDQTTAQVEPEPETQPQAETPAVTETAQLPSQTETASLNTPPVVQATPPASADIPVVNANFVKPDAPVIIIPTDTELIVELQRDLSTKTNRVGDKFTAKIVSPAEIAGAIIEGRIDKIEKPGRIKKRSELSLAFNRIVLTPKRWANFNAVVTEVMPIKGDNVKLVDAEGTAIGKSSVKPDSIKVGGAAGTGLVIGAIAGGPVGAAVGAGIGAAVGVGAVVIQRGKDINLNENQQMRIKTVYETEIR